MARTGMTGMVGTRIDGIFMQEYAVWRWIFVFRL